MKPRWFALTVGCRICHSKIIARIVPSSTSVHSGPNIFVVVVLRVAVVGYILNAPLQSGIRLPLIHEVITALFLNLGRRRLTMRDVGGDGVIYLIQSVVLAPCTRVHTQKLRRSQTPRSRFAYRLQEVSVNRSVSESRSF